MAEPSRTVPLSLTRSELIFLDITLANLDTILTETRPEDYRSLIAKVEAARDRIVFGPAPQQGAPDADPGLSTTPPHR